MNYKIILLLTSILATPAGLNANYRLLHQSKNVSVIKKLTKLAAKNKAAIALGVAAAIWWYFSGDGKPTDQSIQQNWPLIPHNQSAMYNSHVNKSRQRQNGSTESPLSPRKNRNGTIKQVRFNAAGDHSFDERALSRQFQKPRRPMIGKVFTFPGIQTQFSHDPLQRIPGVPGAYTPISRNPDAVHQQLFRLWQQWKHQQEGQQRQLQSSDPAAQTRSEIDALTHRPSALDALI